jgi:GT2 family glycosyltransferase
MAQVDVIIPYYNTPIAFMRQALESVRAQTFQEWCAIVVNDGSGTEQTQDLEALIESLKEQRIVYIKTENRGPPAARNTGIRASSAPYIALLDSDDAWYPKRLEVGIEVLKARPDVDVLHANCDRLLPDGRIVRRVPQHFPELWGGQIDQFRRLLQSNFIAVPTVLGRRCALEDVGLFDEAFDALEDKELWLRMMLYGKRFWYLERRLALYRLHSTNMSKNVHKMACGRRRLIDKLNGMVCESQLLDENEWHERRRSMQEHMYHEIAEGWLDQDQPHRALWYSLPPYSGLSARAARLSLRAVYRGVRKLLGASRGYDRIEAERYSDPRDEATGRRHPPLTAQSGLVDDVPAVPTGDEHTKGQV